MKTRLQLHRSTLFLQVLRYYLCSYLVVCHNQRSSRRYPCITLTHNTVIWSWKRLTLLVVISSRPGTSDYTKKQTAEVGSWWCYCSNSKAATACQQCLWSKWATFLHPGHWRPDFVEVTVLNPLPYSSVSWLKHLLHRWAAFTNTW